MNPNVLALLHKYDLELLDLGVGYNRSEDSARPGQVLSHLRWMIGTLRTEGSSWSVRKVNRWLGFIQGALWVAGVKGIKSLRDDSRHLYDDDGSNPSRPT